MALGDTSRQGVRSRPTNECDSRTWLVASTGFSPLLRSSPGFAQGIGLLIRHQLENILRITALERDGAVVRVDSFGFPHGPCLHDGERDLSAAVEPPDSPDTRPRFSSVLSYQQVEPRLVMVRNLFEHLLRLGSFSHLRHRVDVDGFRLVKLGYWAKYPCSALFENLSFGSLSPGCSCDCDFCFVKGSGPTPLDRRTLRLSEAATRKKYYSREKKKGLPVAGCWPGEPFLNPHIMEFLWMARQADPDTILLITTNGDFLTKATIEELARLKPLSLAVSLNASDPETRRRVMHCKCPSVAVSAIPLLAEHGIQFVGSIVPASSMTIDQIAATARYLDRHSSLLIRFPLPGYTRFQAPPPRAESWWDEVVQLARSLRQELSTPIQIHPSFYWDRDLAARVDGVYRNSPAERAGVRTGDRIEAINDKPVFTKADVWDAFGGLNLDSKERRCAVSLRRNGHAFSVPLVDGSAIGDDFYPYKPAGHVFGQGMPDSHCFGIHVAQGFRLESLRSLKECVERHPDASKVLLFTTPLAKDHFLQALNYVDGIPECRLENVELRVTIAPHKYWGGNIMIGDLHVVEDYIDHLKSLADQGYRPDLVLIPSSFVGVWRFDVLGGSYTEIERQTGVPVELAPTERIMW